MPGPMIVFIKKVKDLYKAYQIHAESFDVSITGNQDLVSK